MELYQGHLASNCSKNLVSESINTYIPVQMLKKVKLL